MLYHSVNIVKSLTQLPNFKFIFSFTTSSTAYLAAVPPYHFVVAVAEKGWIVSSISKLSPNMSLFIGIQWECRIIFYIHKMRLACLAAVALFFFACSIEDPSVAEFDLQKIRLSGDAPFNAYLREPEPYTHADKQVDLFYATSNGDTMKVSVCEFESAILARAFFYNTDSIIEKAEILSENKRKRFLKRGRRLFIFSYALPISENSPTLDSIAQFTRRFPAKDTSASMDFHSFSLKNSRADEDVSVQRDYFLGVEAPFIMLARRYRDADFAWVCARSSAPVAEEDWKNYKSKWQNNFYGQDSAALISRLSNGIVVAVYGDLGKERMRKVFDEFTALVDR